MFITAAQKTTKQYWEKTVYINGDNNMLIYWKTQISVPPKFIVRVTTIPNKFSNSLNYGN